MASRLAVVVAAFLALTLGCKGAEETQPPGGKIRTEWSVVSLKVGESLVLKVDAVDGEENPLTFTASAAGDCATVTAAAGAITIVAGNELCEERILLTSSTAVTQEVIVNVFDPMVMDIGDGLLVRFVNDWVFQWNDAGSGGSEDVSFWHPVAGSGWYPVGSLARNTWADPRPTVPTVVVKDSRGTGALAAPTDYAWIYDDSGSGATLFGSVWKPVCPAGFKALGVVTNGARNGAGWSKPSLDAVRCVSSRYTTPGKIGDRLYHDVGTGASAFLSLWRIDYPDYTSSSDGRAALHAGTSLGCPGWEKTSCDPAIANLLLVPLPVMSNSATDLEPRLTGYQEFDASTPRFFSSVRVPFALIANQAPGPHADRVDWNVDNSPFYTLQREEVYSMIDVIDNRQGTEDALWRRELTTGIEETERSSFSQEVGLEITAGGDAKFLGSGGSWEVKLTGKLGWEQSTSSTYSVYDKRTYEFRIPAGRYAELLQVTTQFRAVPWGGFPASAVLTGASNIIKYMQYPP